MGRCCDEVGRSEDWVSETQRLYNNTDKEDFQHDKCESSEVEYGPPTEKRKRNR